ncbi:hypothetical protein CANCADRAFT_32250 [Tortispora caseinolytica NRRL Y-17796]|uniref:Haloacid dehalogenase n=1 Tax=Tortispora caseinolytica NRRL Y-17796 TaxID=767744 RepID=A0A1E4TAG9_9ASCO|nr:hypothetical protein CANCADRAFT_32250 [Tortispora caseinolytica NRRL Y-17796]
MVADILKDVEAATFDVFGTTLDWLHSIMAVTGLSEKDVKAWRRTYFDPELRKLHPVTTDLYRAGLRVIGKAPEDPELEDKWVNAWAHLKPFPDVIPGLTELRKHIIVGALSNAYVRMLVEQERYAGFTWDLVMGSDLAGCYKPDPRMYQKAAQLLRVDPSKIVMVAAHKQDLEAASKQGFRTIYVYRETEDDTYEFTPDFSVSSFEELAPLFAT